LALRFNPGSFRQFDDSINPDLDRHLGEPIHHEAIEGTSDEAERRLVRALEHDGCGRLVDRRNYEIRLHPGEQHGRTCCPPRDREGKTVSADARLADIQQNLLGWDTGAGFHPLVEALTFAICVLGGIGHLSLEIGEHRLDMDMRRARRREVPDEHQNGIPSVGSAATT
jgi:hypothetical protein